MTNNKAAAFKSSYRGEFNAKVSEPSVVDKQLVASMKGNHFTCGTDFATTPEQHRRHYMTEKKAAFSYKGNALHLKSSVDIALREDLRANHFDFKGTACVLSSTATNTFKRLTTEQIQKSRQQFESEKFSDLRRSHFQLGQRTTDGGAFLDRVSRQPATFVSQNMLQYKWVQPVPRFT